MTLYGRSDVDFINVPVESGGCGAQHLREVTHGARAKLFVLNCVGCESFARSNLSDLWSPTIAEIPETYDQKAEREDWQKRGAQDRDAIMPVLLAKLAGVDPAQLPESLTRAISGTNLHIPGMLECPKGHAQPSGQDFCGKCGTPMHEAVPAMEALTAREAPPAPRIPAAPHRDLASLHPQKLRKMCRENGLDDSGTRPEMVARLEAARKVAA